MAAQQLNWTQGRVVHRAGWWPLNGARWRCLDGTWGRTLHGPRRRALYGTRRRSVDRARWWAFNRTWGRTLHGPRRRAPYGTRRRSINQSWRWTLNRPHALLQQHPTTPCLPAGAQEARLHGRVQPSSPSLGDQRERTAVALPDVRNSRAGQPRPCLERSCVFRRTQRGGTALIHGARRPAIRSTRSLCARIG